MFILGVADIAFASLIAPLIFPEQYCNGKFTHVLNKLLAQDDCMRVEVQDFRNTVAGKYAMDIYQKYR